MSLRSQRDQIESEYAAAEAFDRSLGPALPHFRRMTPEDVRKAVDCPKHGGRRVGDFCGESRSGLFVCLDRRVRAAKAAAGIA